MKTLFRDCAACPSLGGGRRHSTHCGVWWSTSLPSVQSDPSTQSSLRTLQSEYFPSTDASRMHKWGSSCLFPGFTSQHSGNLYPDLSCLHVPLLWTLSVRASCYNSRFCLDFIPTWLSFTQVTIASVSPSPRHLVFHQTTKTKYMCPLHGWQPCGLFLAWQLSGSDDKDFSCMFSAEQM